MRRLSSAFIYSVWSVSIVALFCMACEPQDEILTTDSIDLSFSIDTVFFDTVFTSLGSVTKRLSVRNPSANAIEIQRIRLGMPEGSPFSLTINGMPTNEAENIRLLGKDSLLILATVEIDPQDQDLPFVVQDSIVFETNGNVQDVKIVAWGQDAVFYRGGLQALPCQTTWNSTRPYVVYDSLLVPEGCTLTIEAGTTIHMNPGAALFVAGSLQVEGTVDKNVAFQGVRLEERYQDVAGQWNGVFFLEGSQGSQIEHALIKNAVFGLYIGTPDEDNTPDVSVGYSIIQNMSLAGIQCFSADVYLYNSVISNCARYTFAGLAGGNYTLHHNTLLNYQFDFIRDEPSVLLSDFFEATETEVFQEDLSFEMVNTIVWGSLEDEIVFVPSGNNAFNITISHSLLRTQNTELDINNNLLNIGPVIQGVPADQLFALDTLSPAKDAGILIQGISDDLERKLRDALPDIGALERNE